jgi:hypothetical protein
MLTVCTTQFYAAFQALSMVHLLSLNTQGIKGEDKQINLALYAKRQRADILLQETNLTHCQYYQRYACTIFYRTLQTGLHLEQQLPYIHSSDLT